MKRQDLQPGMWVAVKAGLGSKTCFKALVVDTQTWACTRYDSPVEFDLENGLWANPDAGTGIGIARGFKANKEVIATVAAKLKAERPSLSEWEVRDLARDMTRDWRPEVAKCSLVVEPWDTYEARVEQNRREQTRIQQAKEQYLHAVEATAQKLSQQLGVRIGVHTYPQLHCTLSVEDLNVLAEQLVKA